MTYLLKLFNTGQITLPKVWRSQFPTSNFTAIETPEWLLIKPFFDKSVVFYEDKEWFGLYAPEGMDPDLIISSLKKLQVDG